MTEKNATDIPSQILKRVMEDWSVDSDFRITPDGAYAKAIVEETIAETIKECKEQWGNAFLEGKKEGREETIKEIKVWNENFFVGHVVKGNLPKQRIKDFDEGYECCVKDYKRRLKQKLEAMK